MAYLNYRDTAILDEDDDEDFDGEDRRNNVRHRHHRRAIVPLSQRNIHRLLSFKMTMKMISDMLLRIRSRLPPEKTLSFLSAAFARELPESALAYESWSVCSFCYAIYERDQQLQRIETKFSAALGLPNTKTMDEGLMTASVMPSQLTLCRLVLVINAIYDIPPELYNAELENARMEAAADEVAAAEGRKRSQRANASRLYLRINALGYTECIPINPDDIMEASEKAPVGARRRRDSAASSLSDDDDVESRDDEPQSSRQQGAWQRLSHSRPQHPPSNTTMSTTGYHELDTHHPFFRSTYAAPVKAEGDKRYHSTPDRRQQCRVQLIRATDPPLQDPMELALGDFRPGSQMHGPSHSVVLGSTKIRMTQFRSSYVTKIDYYACMAITGEMLNIKGTLV
ncbi:hypothetical protein GQ600_11142 [Phytophthora cactorum]|nr:hypothetical protein GQ600_11142 [Phytophthora cactorum]